MNYELDDPKYIPCLDHGFVYLVDSMGTDAAIADAARVSYGKGTKSVRENEGLIRYLFRHHHWSPVEMCEAKFHIKLPIFVMRQLVRHRTACLAGNSMLHLLYPMNSTSENPVDKFMSIEKLHNSWWDKNGEKRDLRPIFVKMCDEETGEIKSCRITDIWKSGVKHVYEVVLKNGMSLTMSKDHLCLTNHGWVPLHEAAHMTFRHGKMDTFRTGNAAMRFSVDANGSREYVDLDTIKYVGEEMTYDLSVQGPYHNFVANGLIVHNSLNEYSARYSEMSNEFYIPGLEVIQPQSETNKQGRGGDISEKSKQGVQWLFKAMYDTVYDGYQTLLGSRDKEKFIGDEPLYDAYVEPDSLFDKNYPGLTRELSRSVLSVGNYTEAYFKMDLRNLLHLLKLRMDSHAQYEIRVFANAMYDLIKPLFPISCKAAEDYLFGAYNLSRMEIELVKKLISIEKWKLLGDDDKTIAKNNDMTVRELNEFKMTFGIT